MIPTTTQIKRKGIGKKVLSAILALIMVLGMAPVLNLAPTAEAAVTSQTLVSGQTYNWSSGEYTISGSVTNVRINITGDVTINVNSNVTIDNRGANGYGAPITVNSGAYLTINIASSRTLYVYGANATAGGAGGVGSNGANGAIGYAGIRVPRGATVTVLGAGTLYAYGGNGGNGGNGGTATAANYGGYGGGGGGAGAGIGGNGGAAQTGSGNGSNGSVGESAGTVILQATRVYAYGGAGGNGGTGGTGYTDGSSVYMGGGGGGGGGFPAAGIGGGGAGGGGGGAGQNNGKGGSGGGGYSGGGGGGVAGVAGGAGGSSGGAGNANTSSANSVYGGAGGGGWNGAGTGVTGSIGGVRYGGGGGGVGGSGSVGRTGGQQPGATANSGGAGGTVIQYSTCTLTATYGSNIDNNTGNLARMTTGIGGGAGYSTSPSGYWINYSTTTASTTLTLANNGTYYLANNTYNINTAYNVTNVRIITVGTVTLNVNRSVTITNNGSYSYGAPISILSGTLNLNVASGYALTVYGAPAQPGNTSNAAAQGTSVSGAGATVGNGANGGAGGYAGISVPKGTTLNITGAGTTTATGGNAVNGGTGSAGFSTSDIGLHAGGGGGGGGGGAGAGIGGNGGAGGYGGSGTNQSRWYLNTAAGASGGASGTIHIKGTGKVTATGGGASGAGGGGGQGYTSSCGGGGGGSGYPAAGIGGGGAGGGGGGGGGSDNYNDNDDGGGGGGGGYSGGTGGAGSPGNPTGSNSVGNGGYAGLGATSSNRGGGGGGGWNSAGVVNTSNNADISSTAGVQYGGGGAAQGSHAPQAGGSGGTGGAAGNVYIYPSSSVALSYGTVGNNRTNLATPTSVGGASVVGIGAGLGYGQGAAGTVYSAIPFTMTATRLTNGHGIQIAITTNGTNLSSISVANATGSLMRSSKTYQSGAATKSGNTYTLTIYEYGQKLNSSDAVETYNGDLNANTTGTLNVDVIYSTGAVGIQQTTGSLTILPVASAPTVTPNYDTNRKNINLTWTTPTTPGAGGVAKYIVESTNHNYRKVVTGNNVQITDAELRDNIQNATFKVTPVDREGYLGTAGTNATVTTFGVPLNAPTNINVTPSGNDPTKMTVTWTAPVQGFNTLAITDYQVTVNGPGGYSQTVTVGSNATQKEITGLNAGGGATYTVIVKARNVTVDDSSNPWGPASATYTYVQPSAPGSFSVSSELVEGTRDSRVTVTWTRPTPVATGYSTGSSIIRYEFYAYDEANPIYREGDVDLGDHNPGDKREIKIGELDAAAIDDDKTFEAGRYYGDNTLTTDFDAAEVLEAGHTYKIAVRAVNNYELYTEVDSDRPRGIVGISGSPTDVNVDTSGGADHINVWWKAPLDEEIAEDWPLTGYLIKAIPQSFTLADDERNLSDAEIIASGEYTTTIDDRTFYNPAISLGTLGNEATITLITEDSPASIRFGPKTIVNGDDVDTVDSFDYIGYYYYEIIGVNYGMNYAVNVSAVSEAGNSDPAVSAAKMASVTKAPAEFQITRYVDNNKNEYENRDHKITLEWLQPENARYGTTLPEITQFEVKNPTLGTTVFNKEVTTVNGKTVVRWIGTGNIILNWDFILGRWEDDPVNPGKQKLVPITADGNYIHVSSDWDDDESELIAHYWYTMDPIFEGNTQYGRNFVFTVNSVNVAASPVATAYYYFEPAAVTGVTIHSEGDRVKLEFDKPVEESVIANDTVDVITGYNVWRYEVADDGSLINEAQIGSLDEDGQLHPTETETGKYALTLDLKLPSDPDDVNTHDFVYRISAVNASGMGQQAKAVQTAKSPYNLRFDFRDGENSDTGAKEVIEPFQTVTGDSSSVVITWQNPQAATSGKSEMGGQILSRYQLNIYEYDDDGEIAATYAYTLNPETMLSSRTDTGMTHYFAPDGEENILTNPLAVELIDTEEWTSVEGHPLITLDAPVNVNASAAWGQITITNLKLDTVYKVGLKYRTVPDATADHQYWFSTGDESVIGFRTWTTPGKPSNIHIVPTNVSGQIELSWSYPMLGDRDGDYNAANDGDTGDSEVDTSAYTGDGNALFPVGGDMPDGSEGIVYTDDTNHTHIKDYIIYINVDDVWEPLVRWSQIEPLAIGETLEITLHEGTYVIMKGVVVGINDYFERHIVIITSDELGDGGSYDFKIIAENDVGETIFDMVPARSVSPRRVPDAPTIDTVLTGMDMATLTGITAPRNEEDGENTVSGGGEVTGYIFYAKEVDIGREDKLVDPDSEQSRLTADEWAVHAEELDAELGLRVLAATDHTSEWNNSIAEEVGVEPDTEIWVQVGTITAQELAAMLRRGEVNIELGVGDYEGTLLNGHSYLIAARAVSNAAFIDEDIEDDRLLARDYYTSMDDEHSWKYRADDIHKLGGIPSNVQFVRIGMPQEPTNLAIKVADSTENTAIITFDSAIDYSHEGVLYYKAYVAESDEYDEIPILGEGDSQNGTIGNRYKWVVYTDASGEAVRFKTLEAAVTGTSAGNDMLVQIAAVNANGESVRRGYVQVIVGAPTTPKVTYAAATTTALTLSWVPSEAVGSALPILYYSVKVTDVTDPANPVVVRELTRRFTKQALDALKNDDGIYEGVTLTVGGGQDVQLSAGHKYAVQVQAVQKGNIYTSLYSDITDEAMFEFGLPEAPTITAATYDAGTVTVSFREGDMGLHTEGDNTEPAELIGFAIYADGILRKTVLAAGHSTADLPESVQHDDKFDGFNWEVVGRNPDGDFTATVEGLINGVNYEMTVSAISNSGEGVQSQPVVNEERSLYSRQMPIKESTAPRDVEAVVSLNEATHDSQVTLTWTEPYNLGGSTKVDEYIVKAYTTDGTEVSDSLTIEVNNDKLRAIIQGLTINTEYYFTVEAKTNTEDQYGSTEHAKYGAPGKSNTVRSLKDPSAPTIVEWTDSASGAKYFSLKVTWDAPEDDGGTDIQYYIVHWEEIVAANGIADSKPGTADHSEKIYAKKGISTYSADIYNLKRGESYFIWVEAINGFDTDTDTADRVDGTTCGKVQINVDQLPAVENILVETLTKDYDWAVFHDADVAELEPANFSTLHIAKIRVTFDFDAQKYNTVEKYHLYRLTPEQATKTVVVDGVEVTELKTAEEINNLLYNGSVISTEYQLADTLFTEEGAEILYENQYGQNKPSQDEKDGKHKLLTGLINLRNEAGESEDYYLVVVAESVDGKLGYPSAVQHVRIGGADKPTDIHVEATGENELTIIFTEPERKNLAYGYSVAGYNFYLDGIQLPVYNTDGSVDTTRPYFLPSRLELVGSQYGANNVVYNTYKYVYKNLNPDAWANVEHEFTVAAYSTHNEYAPIVGEYSTPELIKPWTQPDEPTEVSIQPTGNQTATITLKQGDGRDGFLYNNVSYHVYLDNELWDEHITINKDNYSDYITIDVRDLPNGFKANGSKYRLRVQEYVMKDVWSWKNTDIVHNNIHNWDELVETYLNERDNAEFASELDAPGTWAEFVTGIPSAPTITVTNEMVQKDPESEERTPTIVVEIDDTINDYITPATKTYRVDVREGRADGPLVFTNVYNLTDDIEEGIVAKLNSRESKYIVRVDQQNTGANSGSGLATANTSYYVTVTTIVNLKEGETCAPVAVAPAAPDKPWFTIYDGKDGEAELGWRCANNGSAPVNYWVLSVYDIEGNLLKDEKIYNESGAETDPTVTITKKVSDLINGRQYVFTVYGVNGSGKGQISDPVTVMPASKPAQTVVTVTALTNTQVTLVWTVDEYEGMEPIDHFTIEDQMLYVPLFDVNNPSKPITKIDANAREITLTGLRQGETYKFVITAMNANGEGIPSEPVTVVTHTRSEAPRLMSVYSANGVLLVRWMEPDNLKLFENIDRYRITVTPTTTSGNQTGEQFVISDISDFVVDTNGAISYVIYGGDIADNDVTIVLENQETYAVTVAAAHSYVLEADSDALLYSAESDTGYATIVGAGSEVKERPTEPLSVTAAIVGDEEDDRTTDVEVSWKAPILPGGTITDYIIYIDDDIEVGRLTGAAIAAALDEATSIYSIRITTEDIVAAWLAENSGAEEEEFFDAEHSFYVKAKNNAVEEESRASATATLTLLPAKSTPAKVENVKYYTLTDRSAVVLTWDDQQLNNGTVGYFVWAGINGDKSAKHLLSGEQPLTETTFTTDALTAKTVIWIEAVNTAGRYEESAAMRSPELSNPIVAINTLNIVKEDADVNVPIDFTNPDLDYNGIADQLLPSAPYNLNATVSVDNTKITLSWKYKDNQPLDDQTRLAVAEYFIINIDGKNIDKVYLPEVFGEEGYDAAEATYTYTYNANLITNKTYAVVITAVNQDGKGIGGYATLDVFAPTTKAPTNVRAESSVDGRQVTVTWTAPEDPNFHDNYVIDVDGVTANNVNIDEVNCVATFTTNYNTSYIVRVGAQYGTDTVYSSAVVIVTSVAKPLAPTITTFELAGNGIRVAWNDPNEVAVNFTLYINNARITNLTNAASGTIFAFDSYTNYSRSADGYYVGYLVAEYAGQSSDNSNIKTILAEPERGTPEATEITVTEVDTMSGTVTLTWTEVDIPEAVFPTPANPSDIRAANELIIGNDLVVTWTGEFDDEYRYTLHYMMENGEEMTATPEQSGSTYTATVSTEGMEEGALLYWVSVTRTHLGSTATNSTAENPGRVSLIISLDSGNSTGPNASVMSIGGNAGLMSVTNAADNREMWYVVYAGTAINDMKPIAATKRTEYTATAYDAATYMFFAVKAIVVQNGQIVSVEENVIYVSGTQLIYAEENSDIVSGVLSESVDVSFVTNETVLPATNLVLDEDAGVLTWIDPNEFEDGVIDYEIWINGTAVDTDVIVVADTTGTFINMPDEGVIQVKTILHYGANNSLSIDAMSDGLTMGMRDSAPESIASASITGYENNRETIAHKTRTITHYVYENGDSAGADGDDVVIDRIEVTSDYITFHWTHVGKTTANNPVTKYIVNIGGAEVVIDSYYSADGNWKTQGGTNVYVSGNLWDASITRTSSGDEGTLTISAAEYGFTHDNPELARPTQTLTVTAVAELQAGGELQSTTTYTITYGMNRTDVQTNVVTTVEKTVLVVTETVEVPVYVQETDEEGNPVFDEEGNPVYVQETDEEGNPVFDEEGNPVYEQATDPVTGEPLTEEIEVPTGEEIVLEEEIGEPEEEDEKTILEGEDKDTDGSGEADETPLVDGNDGYVTVTITATFDYIGGTSGIAPTITILASDGETVLGTAELVSFEDNVLVATYRFRPSDDSYIILIEKAACTYFALTGVPMEKNLTAITIDDITLHGGDVNGDGIVDTLDYLMVMANYNQETDIGDANGDGIVDTLDYLMVMANYNTESEEREWTRP